MSGVNAELMPYVRMTYPKSMSNLDDFVGEFVPGEVVFTSYLLLFGFIPFDIHWLAIDSFVDGVSFCENSSSVMHKFWKHKRTLSVVPEPTVGAGGDNSGSGCNGCGGVDVTDEVEFCPRLPLLGYLLQYVVYAVFQNRHSKLRRMNCS